MQPRFCYDRLVITETKMHFFCVPTGPEWRGSVWTPPLWLPGMWPLWSPGTWPLWLHETWPLWLPGTWPLWSCVSGGDWGSSCSTAPGVLCVGVDTAPGPPVAPGRGPCGPPGCVATPTHGGQKISGFLVRPRTKRPMPYVYRTRVYQHLGTPSRVTAAQ